MERARVNGAVVEGGCGSLCRAKPGNAGSGWGVLGKRAVEIVGVVCELPLEELQVDCVGTFSLCLGIYATGSRSIVVIFNMGSLFRVKSEQSTLVNETSCESWQIVSVVG